MFLLLEKLLKWILGCFGWEQKPVEEPLKNLQGKARKEIATKLKTIRLKNDNDISRLMVPRYHPESVSLDRSPSIKSIDAFIEFHSALIIEKTPDLIFEGTFLKQKKVAIKRVGSNDAQLTKEMKIADQVKYHEGFLVHLFGFNQLSVNYIAMEYYTCTLDDVLLSLDDNIIPSNVLTQLCNGLEFLHSLSIAHYSVSTHNVVVIYRAGQHLCKISNFRSAINTTHEIDFKQDVEALGLILLYVMKCKNVIRQFSQNELDFSWSLHNKTLCMDLVEKMLCENFRNRPEVKEIKTHPFLWTSRESLLFIIELSKTLESPSAKNFAVVLKKHSDDIFGKDWRGHIDKHVLDELEAINLKTLSLPKSIKVNKKDISLKSDIVGLVKTIRNMVRLKKLFYC